jgi:anti-sigma factor ChrR (cupin superfamily)
LPRDVDLTPDVHRPLAEAFALGTLAPSERSTFEAHLRSGCEECRQAVEGAATALAVLGGSVPPEAHVRQQILDLAAAPRLPIDPGAYPWQEIAPGIRLHVLREDPTRDMRGCLAWAQPGARNAVHRHGGDELILVLQGALRDGRREYGPGELCHSRAGSVHFEEVLDRGDCFSYVVYYGPLIYLP